MRDLCVVLVSAGLGLIAMGCMLDGGVRRGAMITSVQAEWGLPDVISDSAGDRSRFYVPTDRPEHEWAWEAPRTFYYLDRGVAVTFERGKAVEAGPIDDERRRWLTELVQRHRRS